MTDDQLEIWRTISLGATPAGFYLPGSRRTAEQLAAGFRFILPQGTSVTTVIEGERQMVEIVRMKDVL